ncbi:MAG: glycosyltransferase family 39 protein [Bacteroidota bacterium]
MNKISIWVKEHYFLTSIILVSTFLRIYHIDFQSLWVDEINTMAQATPYQGFRETYKSLLATDLQPPLYFYILKYLFRIFGYTTLVMRLFSAFLGIAGVWAIYLLGKEIFNKKAGLLAAAILCLNIFHIHYSQEGRPYAFLTLFAILSFYRLCRYIKNPSYKNVIIYSVFACLMLYGHPFGLFALLSQYCIIFYYFVLYDVKKRIALLKHGAISILITSILYIPAIPLLASAANVDSFWIELPGKNEFANILSQYFGDSEIILSIVYLSLIIFFIRMFNETGKYNKLIRADDSNYINSYIILIPWITACIVIPLIRSYLKVPMIIPRYLIIVLPAVILIISIGILQIKHTLVKYSFFGLFIIFSLVDIFVVKDFYNKRTKTDFRGITNYVIKNIHEGDELVSRVGWHYSYFFDNSTPKVPVLWNSFDAYVGTMMKWPDNYKHPFWFVDAQNAPLTLNPEQTAYLNEHFYIHNRKDLYSALGIYYIYKTTNYFKPQFKDQSQLNNTNNDPLELATNTTVSSIPMHLEKGNYYILISGRSLPDVSVNDINAHLSIKINGKSIGGIFMNENESVSTQQLKFHLNTTEDCSVEIIYDNSFSLGNKTRKAVLSSVYFEKI